MIWARTTRRKSPDELYRLSHEFRARLNAEDKHFVLVADKLRALAAKRGHKQAGRERDEWHRNKRNKKTYWSPRHHAWLMDRVRKGEPAAMASLATRYKRAEGAEKDLAKAYYWLLRAKKGGWDVALAISNLDRRVSGADRDRALKWLAKRTVLA